MKIFDDYKYDFRTESEKRRELMYDPPEKKTFLDTVGTVLNFPQSILAHTLESGNPFKALTESKYLSDALGIEGYAGLGVDMIFDPINFVGGAGLGTKLGRLTGISRKLLRGGVDAGKLANHLDVLKSANRIDDVMDLIKGASAGTAGWESKLNTYNKAEVVLSNISESAKKFTPGKDFARYKLDAVADLKNAIGESRAVQTNLYRKINDLNPEQFSKEADKYLKHITTKGKPEAISKLDEAKKTISGLDEMLAGENVADIAKVIEVYKDTGKFADQLTYAEKVRHGLSGVGVGLPLNKVGYKTMFPTVQGKLMGTLEAGLSKIPVASVIPKTAEELKNMSRIEKAGYRMATAAETVGNRLLRGFVPAEKYKYEIKKAVQMTQQGRGMESAVIRDIDNIGNIASISEGAIAHWLKTGGNADKYVVDNLKRVFDDPTLIAKLADKELIGMTRLIDEIAKKVGVNAKDVDKVTQIRKVVVALGENDDNLRKISNLSTKEVFERVGLDKDLVDGVVKAMLDEDYQRTLMAHKGLMDAVLKKETAIGKTMPKAIRDLFISEGVENYVLHKMNPQLLKYLEKNPGAKSRFGGSIMSMLHSSMKHRELVKFTDNVYDKVLDFYRLGNTRSADELFQAMTIGLDSEKDVLKLQGYFNSAIKKVSPEDMKHASTAARRVIDDVQASILHGDDNAKLIDKLIKNNDMTLMSNLDANVWWKNIHRGSPMGKMDLFTTDLPTLLDARMRKYFKTNGKYHYTREMGEQLVGMGVAKPYAGTVEKGFIKGQHGHLKDFIIKEDFDQMIHSMFKGIFKMGQAVSYAKDIGALGGLIRLNQSIIKGWKKITTSPFPSFHARNSMGNFFLMWLNGMPVNEIRRLEWKLGGKFKKDIIKHGEIQRASFADFSLKAKNGKVYSGDELYDLVMATGIHHGFFDNEIGKVMGGFMENWKDGKKLSALQTVSSSIEGSARTEMFLWGLKEGLSPEQAVKLVNKSLFDYANVPKAIGTLRDNVFPFITWYWYNIPMQLEMMIRRPHIASWFTKLRNHTKDMALGDYAPYEGEYGRDRFAVYLPRHPLEFMLGKSGGDHNDYSQLTLEGFAPFLDLNKFGNIAGELMNLTAPHISYLIESKTNLVTALGNKPVERYEGENVTFMGLPMKATEKHILQKAWRGFGMADKLNLGNIFGTYEKPGVFGYTRSSPYGENVTSIQKGLGFFTGLQFSDIKPEWGMISQQISLRNKKTILSRELSKMVQDPNNRLRQKKLADLARTSAELREIERMLSSYTKQYGGR